MDQLSTHEPAMRSNKTEKAADSKPVPTDSNLEAIISVQTGTIDSLPSADDAVLRANGHSAAMIRQFSWLSALGLGFSITNSWIGYLVSAAPQAVRFSPSRSSLTD